MRLLVQGLLAVVIASITPLMSYYEEWAIYYGVEVLGVTLIALLVPGARFSARSVTDSLLLLSLLLVPVMLSTVLNQPETVPLENIGMVLFYAILGLSLFDARRPGSFVGFFCLVAAAQLLVMPWLFSEAALVELSDLAAIVQLRRDAFDFEGIDLHPNTIGMLCVILVLAAVRLPGRGLRVGLVGFAVVISWLMSSRASLLAIVIIGVSVLGCRLLDFKLRGLPRSRNTVLMMLAGLAAVALLAYTNADFLFHDVLLLDDDERGIGTGFTGRLEIWQAAYELWRENFFFGVGYGQHVEQMGLGIYAHNMMLVLLSELGLFGLAGFGLFSILCLRNGVRLMQAGAVGPATYIITVIVSYWGYGLFEGKAVSAGNPISAIYFLCCFASVGYGLPRPEATPPPASEV
jgi:O-antigen ligase